MAPTHASGRPPMLLAQRPFEHFISPHGHLPAWCRPADAAGGGAAAGVPDVEVAAVDAAGPVQLRLPDRHGRQKCGGHPGELTVCRTGTEWKHLPAARGEGFCTFDRE